MRASKPKLAEYPNMSRHNLEPDAERARLEALLNQENAKSEQLRRALAEFRHSNRRMTDRLERVGGRDTGLESQRSLLHDNLRLTEDELAKSEARTNEIRRSLEQLAADRQS